MTLAALVFQFLLNHSTARLSPMCSLALSILHLSTTAQLRSPASQSCSVPSGIIAPLSDLAWASCLGVTIAPLRLV